MLPNACVTHSGEDLAVGGMFHQRHLYFCSHNLLSLPWDFCFPFFYYFSLLFFIFLSIIILFFVVVVVVFVLVVVLLRCCFYY